MRGLTSALLLASGVGLGIYAHPHISAVWQDATDRARGEQRVVASAPPSASPVSAAEPVRRSDDSGSRVFSPQQPLFARVPTTPEVEPKAKTGTVVAVDQVAGPFRPATVAEPEQKVARSDDARRQLVRDLQRELRRVGCYDGELTGEWTADVRRALKTFTDRVNARLPLEDPDYILLTLVRGHTDTACGKGCPSGQAMADGGRCVPKGLVAKAARKETIETSSADAAPSLKQGPQPARRTGTPSTASADRPTSSSSWSTAITTAPVARPDAGSLVASAPVAVAPMPGRMTLGVAPVATGSIPRPDVTGTEPPAREQRRPGDARLAAASPPADEAPTLPPASGYDAALPVNPSPTPRPAVEDEDPRRHSRRSTSAPPRYIPPSYYSAPKASKSIANRQWARKVFDNSSSGR